MFYAVFGVLAIILDQWVKYWTAGNLVYGGEAKVFIPGLINLINVHNDGAAFSFLSGANAGGLFVILAVVFTGLVIVGLITNFISGNLARWCAVMVAAGGIGNAIDRALYGYVQDMIQIAFLDTFPVFNIADIFITVFCLLFIICIIFGDKKSKADADDIEYEIEEEEDFPNKGSRRASAREELPKRSTGRSRRARDDYDDDYEEDEEPPRRNVRTREDDRQDAPVRRAQRQEYAQDQLELQDRQRQDNVRRSAQVQRQQSSEQPVRERPAAQSYGRQTQLSLDEEAFDSIASSNSRRSAPAQESPKAAPTQSKPVSRAGDTSSSFDLDDILSEFK